MLTDQLWFRADAPQAVSSTSGYIIFGNFAEFYRFFEALQLVNLSQHSSASMLHLLSLAGAFVTLLCEVVSIPAQEITYQPMDLSGDGETQAHPETSPTQLLIHALTIGTELCAIQVEMWQSCS